VHSIVTVAPVVHSCQALSGPEGTSTITLQPHSVQELRVTCSQAQLTTIVQLPIGADSAELSDLLPNCDYSFEATNQNGELVSCDLETPIEQGINLLFNSV